MQYYGQRYSNNRKVRWDFGRGHVYVFRFNNLVSLTNEINEGRSLDYNLLVMTLLKLIPADLDREKKRYELKLLKLHSN